VLVLVWAVAKAGALVDSVAGDAEQVLKVAANFGPASRRW